MKHVDTQRFENVGDMNPKISYVHSVNCGKIFPGNIRLNLGLYRTPKETERYISESLKRKLP